MKAKPIYVVECGCCSCYHREEYRDDCRNDEERFPSPEEAATRLNSSVVEVDDNGCVCSFEYLPEGATA